MRSRPALRFFEGLVDELVGDRRALIERGEAPPNDLMTLLLGATDPETGRPLTDLEVRANIIAFLAAGHETTANALTWALYLLSQQSPETRDQPGTRGRCRHRWRQQGWKPRTTSCSPGRSFDEAIRLYPPDPVHEPGGHRRRTGWRPYPHPVKGSLIMIAPYVLHRHRRLCGRIRTAFDPDRFMPGRREAIDRHGLPAVRCRPASLHRRVSFSTSRDRDRAGPASAVLPVPDIEPGHAVLEPVAAGSRCGRQNGLPMLATPAAAEAQFFFRNASRLTTSAAGGLLRWRVRTARPSCRPCACRAFSKPTAGRRPDLDAGLVFASAPGCLATLVRGAGSGTGCDPLGLSSASSSSAPSLISNLRPNWTEGSKKPVRASNGTRSRSAIPENDRPTSKALIVDDEARRTDAGARSSCPSGSFSRRRVDSRTPGVISLERHIEMVLARQARREPYRSGCGLHDAACSASCTRRS